MILENMAYAASFLAAALSLVAAAFIIEKLSDRRRDLDKLRKEEMLRRYDAPLSMAAIRARCTGGGIVAGCVIVVLTQNIVFAILAVAIGMTVTLMYPGWVQRRYMRQFEGDFAECLSMWARCMHSGLSLQQAIAAAADDMKGPVAREMATLRSETGLGDIEGALWNFYARMSTDDVRYAVLGVITCRRTGGRMSEVVANIAKSLRERGALRDKIMAITSMGRTEAYVMGAMPLAIGCGMYLLQPETMDLLFTTPLGVIGTLFAAGWEFIGLAIIWKIVNMKP